MDDLVKEIVKQGTQSGLNMDEVSVAFTLGYCQNENVFEANIERMVTGEYGSDVVIVCCSNQSQEDFWQDRLEKGTGVIPSKSTVVAVHEDWKGGAGNGLGTLYAFQKANAKFESLKGKSLLQHMVEDNASVAMYHTAGKGTRLAPLPGSESNNKPAVKLPGIVSIDGKEETMTILEAVIKQTGVYADSRCGRLSVYWGDQIFVPSKSTTYTANSHVDILAKLGKWPTKEQWINGGLDQFGLIIVSQSGAAAQVEKVDYDTACALVKEMGDLTGVGTSLGSFSVSHGMLQALLDEFQSELSAKSGKMDTDPHFWMPMTLPKEGYGNLMTKKGMEKGDAEKHWDRIAAMVEKLMANGNSDVQVFGAVDVGEQPYWWDYGQIKYYYDNNIALTHNTNESQQMRKFFGVAEKERVSPKGSLSGVDVCPASVSLCCGPFTPSSKSVTGIVKGSVLINCNIDHIDVTDSILVNVTAKSVTGKHGILYNIVSPEDSLTFAEKEVKSSAFIPGDNDANYNVSNMHSTLDSDGRTGWSQKLFTSDYSAEALHKLNQNVDVRDACKLMQRRIEEIRKS